MEAFFGGVFFGAKGSPRNSGHSPGFDYKVDHYLTPPCMQWEILMTHTNQRRQDIIYKNTVRQLGLEEGGGSVGQNTQIHKYTAHLNRNTNTLRIPHKHIAH